MKNKCLVSKISGVIEDDNMKILGALQFTGMTDKVYSNVILTSADNNCSVQAKNCTMLNSSQKVICNDEKDFIVPQKREGYSVQMNNTGTLTIRNKYNLTTLLTGGMIPLFKTSDLKFCTSIHNLSFGGTDIVGVLDDFTLMCNCTEFNLKNLVSVTGDLTDFLNKLATNRDKLKVEDSIVRIIASTSFTNIPMGISTVYSSQSNVKFTSARDLYPNGWFVCDAEGNPHE